MTKTAGRKPGLAHTAARTVLTLVLGVASGGLSVGAAYAQDEDGERDEVIVTAQRRAQAIQDVPIAINAFSGDQLEASSINDVADLPMVTPSLFVNSTGSAASDTTIRIRGVGTTGNNPGLEGAVGVFIDGVYRNRSGMALGQLSDVERIEVLRGPQSTLFGKNTSAGALSIITREPEFDRVAGGGTFNFGSPDLLGGNAYLNLPVSENLALRFSGGWNSREGFIENRNTGGDNQDANQFFLRAQALWELSPDASLRLIYDVTDVDNNGNTAVRARHQGARSVTVNTIEANRGMSLTGTGTFDSNSLNSDPFNNANDQGLSAELNWDLSDAVTFTNIIAYRDFDRVAGGDTDFTGADLLNAYGTESYQSFTNEFRFVGEAGRLEWLAGGFFGQETVSAFTRLEFGIDTGSYLCGLFTANLVASCFNDTGFQPASINTTFIGDNNFNPNLVIAGEGSEGVFEVESESWSVFAQGTWALTEQLSATLGVRYIDEHKEGFGDNTVDNTVALTDNNSLPPFLGLVNDFVAEVDDTAVTGTFNVQYDFTPDVMGYVSYARGYKAGGINLDRTSATVITPLTGAQPVGNPTFREELSDNIEAGVKTQWFDRRLGLNLTAFHTEFENLQILSFTGLAFIVETMPEATTQGVELEAYWEPVDNLLFNLGVTYADTEYGDGALLTQSLPNPPINLEGLHFTNAPEWSGSLGMGYRWNLVNDLDAYFRIDGFYGSERSTSSAQGPDKEQDAYSLVNFRAGLAHGAGWDLSLWCRNCGDTEYYQVLFNSVFQNSATSPNVDGYIGDGRELGVSLSVDF